MIKFKIWDNQYQHYLEENGSSLHCSSRWCIDAFTGELIDLVSCICDHSDSVYIDENPKFYLAKTGIVFEPRYKLEFDPESAAEFLRSKGYKIKPPAEPSPVPNGCFRVECAGVDKPFFVEGGEEEKEEISLDFQQRGYKVEKIEFAKDQFYFL